MLKSPMAVLSALILAGGPGLGAGTLDADLNDEVVQRRKAVMEKMNGHGIMILFSAEPRRYSRNIFYQYRQENNFYYLSGIRQPNAILVLMPQNLTYREILFIPERDPTRELWTGRMLSAEEASDISGIPHVWEASEFEDFVSAILAGTAYQVDRYRETSEYEGFFSRLRAGQADVYLLLDERPGLRGEPSPEWRFAEKLRQRFVGFQIRDASDLIHDLRMIKSPYEVEQLRRAVDITVEAQNQAIRGIRPGVWEYEVEAVVDYVFKKRNAFDWAFPSIVASGPNATVLHYEESQRQAQTGELLLCDVGAEYNYYAADITRTVPVSGRFSPRQAEIYQLVLDAQNAAMAKVRPGASMDELHQSAVEVLKQGLVRLGLIADAAGDQYRVFFPHGVGHWLGMNVHDVGPRFRKFAPGMVLTVEPGIYIRQDSVERMARLGVEAAALERIRTAIEPYLNIGVRIEDVVLVTEDGYEHLSRHLPREIREIEQLMAAAP